MPLNLNNNQVTGVDLNNTEVSEVRLNGQTVFTGIPPTPALLPSAIINYQFAEGTGTTTSDFLGANPDATFADNPQWVQGNFIEGTAIDFSNGGYLIAPFFNGFGNNVRDGPVTFMCTVQFPGTVTDNNFIGFHSEDNNRDAYRFVVNDGGGLSLTYSDAADDFNLGSSTASINPYDGNRHRIGFTHDGGSSSSIDLFFDGASAGYSPGRSNASDNMGSFDHDCNIGNENQEGVNGARNATFEGIIDDLVFYQKQLTPSEIQTDFQRLV